MSYIDETLGSNEALHYRARFPTLHRIGAWSIVVVAVLIAIALALDGLTWIGAIVVVAGAAFFMGIMVPIWTTEIGVTTQRFIYKRGLIWRSTKELQLRSIEVVNLEQGLLGRLLNYGRLALHGTGMDDIQLPPLADPVVLQKAIQEAIGAVTHAQTPAAAEPNSGSLSSARVA